MSLINIAKDDSKPLYVESRDITAIHTNISEKGVPEIAIYTAKGQLLYAAAPSMNLDAGIMVEKLRAAGVPLVDLPVRWPAANDTLKEYGHFINAEAVTFATVSQKDKDGRYGTIVGVKGIGREESYGTTQEELDALIAAVKAVKQFDVYGPETVTSRWHQASALYIDPAAVTQVQEDPIQVNVHFEGSGALDIQVPDVDPNKRLNELANDNPQQRSLDFLYAQARREAEAAERKLRGEFARAVARGGRNMIEIPAPGPLLFLNRDNMAVISFADDARTGDKYIGLRAQKTAENPYTNSVTLVFKTAAERLACFEKLREKLEAPAAVKTPAKPKKASPQP